MPLIHSSVPETFIISIFGAQYDGSTPAGQKAKLITEFDSLIRVSATHLDPYIEKPSEQGPSSRIWVSYWKSPVDFREWWASTNIATFWNVLPDDAGFWRETMQFFSSRFLNEVTQELPSGVGHLGPLSPLTEKSGYWGAYRDRIDEATAQDKLSSPLEHVPNPRPVSNHIREGRVVMNRLPDNICFVIEGQDHSPMQHNETKVWSEKFHRITKRWITNALRAGPDGGLLSARMCHVPESGLIKVQQSDTPDDLDFFPELNTNRKLEIFYFLELRYMERLGRRDKTHVALRKEFMDTYGPEGIMSHGDLLLWVELGVLKSNEIEAEYIGCCEGTGFLAYDHHSSFSSTVSFSSAKNGA
ncbi:hypothetical protein BS50DRAFT_566743 [Corynespora cassiicola Philippines]|uniref:Phenylacetaldoxime dehydratase n=1 Tax=Corynespora cassiicola Philippines TaxID=1448308 RepID=A0A2T2P841_CORCC|nr:hypothetical protein BS50DRAFT_566743 [Corynespora cassiicola Philippines]